MSEDRAKLGRATALRAAADVTDWYLETDVLVVGQGAAGACAAVGAREIGARALVLERAGGGGGTSANSTGEIYLGGGTPVQKACGFDDTPDEMYAYLMASCGPSPDEAKIRLYCDRSVDHFHWLVSQGVRFKHSFYGEGSYIPTDDCLAWSGSELNTRYAALAKPAPRGHTVQREGIEAGGELMRALCEATGRAGARVLVDCRVETLVQDHERRVVGVVARQGGEERCLRARGGVVLCAGGFINNREMVEHHAPWLRRCRMRMGVDGDDGRGIRMGQGAGGEAIRMDTACIVLPFTVPKQHVKGILVNQQGQRFINEDAYQSEVGAAALRAQDGQVYLIVDDEIYERPFPPVEISAVGDRIEELERELGMPEDSLQHTVSYYNRHAARGVDPLFQKTAEFLKPLTRPPFAALDYRVEHSIWSVFTMGGLHTSVDGEVLTADGDTVPGLYAAGRTTSGLAAQGYSSGLSLADATFFGRRAGAAAAREAERLRGARPGRSPDPVQKVAG
jgi:succinate dehydrogenase/fumarate reductase flavoprotein subunit